MKPTIFKAGPWWCCQSGGGDVGVGATPIEAYHRWWFGTKTFIPPIGEDQTRRLINHDPRNLYEATHQTS